MALTTLNIPAFLDTSSADLIADFFTPLLAASIKYDRGVGYFSSGWLRVAGKGMAAFAANGGKARWVTSPILDEEDWKALETGDMARRDLAVYEALRSTLTSLAATLEQETLAALVWMVADEILEFRLAVPTNKLDSGDFHDKFGVFTDAAGNRVSFNGSYNDSMKGLRNYESIKAFRSWEPALAGFVEADAARFEQLWTNNDPNVEVFDLPSAAREDILRLRVGARPYPMPEWARSKSAPVPSLLPHVPDHLSLRDYQQKAIRAWFDHNGMGLLEMATGSGKTVTALTASVQLFSREGRLAVIFAVPYQHLVDQWQREAQAFGYKPLLAYQSKARWINDLNTQVMEYNAGYRDVLSVITTHTTFASPDFQRAIGKLSGAILLVADEVHHLGSAESRQAYPLHVPFRLALSATPDRWFDDVGTSALRDYFGTTVFSFPIEQAIGVCLTPYYYRPHLVPLTDDELERYVRLSAKIVRLMHQKEEEGQAALKMLLMQRADLLNNAANKLSVLSDLIDAETRVEHTLFYCAPAQIDSVVRLLGWDKGLLVHKFTAEESARERQRLLTEFACGNLQALAAMRCLDEGVDVPGTRTAFLLASSSNPREFIQRRGRVLRKAPGKEFAVIHDLIAVPPLNWDNAEDSPAFASERSIVRKELERFKEFANCARNKHEALDVVWDMARRYGLMDF